MDKQHREEWATPVVFVYGNAAEIIKSGDAKCKKLQLSDDYNTGQRTVDPSECVGT